jgi:hypothetical protein
MSRIAREISRLYLPDDLSVQPHAAAEGAQWCLVSPQGQTRALVLELAHPADWSLMGEVWRGVQADLALPAPAIAVSGLDAFQLWFSLAEPVDAALGARMLSALCSRYLPQVRADRLCLWPTPAQARAIEAPHATLVTAVPMQRSEGQWSAFVAPDLAPVFEDTPWLDIPPNEEGQADLLSRLQRISPRGFEQALKQLGLDVNQEDVPTPHISALHALSGPRADAQQFLMQVMNTKSLPMSDRIAAARALLQHGS